MREWKGVLLLLFFFSSAKLEGIGVHVLCPMADLSSFYSKAVLY